MRAPTLSRILVLRIALFAVLAMLVQAVVLFTRYYFDNPQLATMIVDQETRALAAGLRVTSGEETFVLPPDLHRYTRADAGYFTRIRTPEGHIIYSDCDASCEEHLLPREVSPPDVWSRLLRPDKPLAVAGGEKFQIGGVPVLVEVAVLDDHQKVMRSVLLRELADDLAMPMCLMLVFALGGMLISVHLALQPVKRAAAAAEALDPVDPAHMLDSAGMPREIANLTSAVNRSLGRIVALMRAQRVFTTAVAHEIRTPLAMMKLELATIEDPRARKVEKDLESLAHFVSQVTDLGRLESAGRADFQPLDLTTLTRTVVSDIAPWVYDNRHSISFEPRAKKLLVEGKASLLESAVRNLIENAVKHTPDGTSIQVEVGPDRSVSVIDNAGVSREPSRAGLPDQQPTSGIGLEIIRRIMSLHRGRLEHKVERQRFTAMQLHFEETT